MPQCVAVCVSVCCSVSECVVVCCSVLLQVADVGALLSAVVTRECVAMYCSVLQHVAVRCTLQHAATLEFDPLTHIGCVLMGTHIYTATYCNTLQHTATYCNTLIYLASLYRGSASWH